MYLEIFLNIKRDKKGKRDSLFASRREKKSGTFLYPPYPPLAKYYV